MFFVLSHGDFAGFKERTMFDALDDNANGRLSTKEIKLGFRKHPQIDISLKRAIK